MMYNYSIITRKQSENSYLKNFYDAEKLGKIIRQQRLSQNMSQAFVANSANINHSYYCSIELGKANITIKKMLSICNCLEIQPDEIIRSLCKSETHENLE